MLSELLRDPPGASVAAEPAEGRGDGLLHLPGARFL
jgi:hypothetical protein